MTEISDRSRAEAQRDIAVAALEFVRDHGWGGIVCELYVRNQFARITRSRRARRRLRRSTISSRPTELDIDDAILRQLDH